MTFWRNTRIFLLLTALVMPHAGFATSTNSNDCNFTPAQLLQELLKTPGEHRLLGDVVDHDLIHPEFKLTGHAPSEAEFAKRFSHQAQDSTQKQTWMEFDHKLYEVKRYSPETERVFLTRNELVNHKFSELERYYHPDQIREGNILALNHEKYQVIGIDQFTFNHADKIVHLARRNTVSVPYADIEKSLDASVHLSDLKRFLNRMHERAHSSENEFIPLAGNQIHLVGSSTENFVYPLGASYNAPKWDLIHQFKLPDDYPLQITLRDGSPKTITMKDLTPAMEWQISRVQAYTQGQPPKLLADFQRFYKWDTHADLLFNMTPVESKVYDFRIGDASHGKSIRVYAPTSKIPGQDEKDFKRLSEFIKKIPEPLHEFLDVIHFDPGASGFGLAAASDKHLNDGIEHQIIFYLKDQMKTSVVSDILDRPGIHDSLWHETGHLLQAKIASLIPNFDWTLWEHAMVQDQKWTTAYAMTKTSEDFPETVARYIRTDGGRLEPQARELYRARFEILDRAFQQLIEH